MSEERQPLLASLRDTFIFFRERKTVGRMKTEHSIFIPSALMINQSEETEEFIKAVRYINNHRELGCPVEVEQVTMVKVTGAEFVFTFSPDTDFDAIIEYVESKLN